MRPDSSFETASYNVEQKVLRYSHAKKDLYMAPHGSIWIPNQPKKGWGASRYLKCCELLGLFYYEHDISKDHLFACLQAFFNFLFQLESEA